MRGRARIRIGWSGAAVACALAMWSGCAAEEPTTCGMAWLRGDGTYSADDPLATPLDAGEVRRVICMRGLVPCADETVHLAGSSEEVVAVRRDSVVAWVFHVFGLAPGRATLVLTCGREEQHSLDVEVQ
ncbi:MAG: hypothetical protein JXB32_08575 [Deltaproteobacteria bacterium]|nr:hypothetical protein [Deltaproteobacteria bacterium]